MFHRGCSPVSDGESSMSHPSTYAHIRRCMHSLPGELSTSGSRYGQNRLDLSSAEVVSWRETLCRTLPWNSLLLGHRWWPDPLQDSMSVHLSGSPDCVSSAKHHVSQRASGSPEGLSSPALPPLYHLSPMPAEDTLRPTVR